MQDSEIRWGILGGGKVVESKSGPCFNIPGRSRVAAVCRRDAENASATAERLGANLVLNQLEDMVESDEVQAVYIATPPGLHHSQAMVCLNARKPVYIEKPFTTSAAQAEELVRNFAEVGIPLFVAHYRRALPKFREIKSLIETQIGQPLEFSFRLKRRLQNDVAHPWMYDRELSGGGKFFDIAPHCVDLLLFLFGDVDQMSAEAKHWKAPQGSEDCVTLNFRFKSGVLGTANFNFLAWDKEDRMSVHGEKGILEFSVHGNEPSTLRLPDGKVRQFFHTVPELIEGPMIEEVVAFLRGEEGKPCMGQDAVPVIELIESAARSLH